MSKTRSGRASKRLQVLLNETELAEIRKAARRQHMTTAEWVRQALRAARRNIRRRCEGKLEVVRAASRHGFPSADIEQLVAEIERGYRGGEPQP
ncbi:MAG: antitoxin [Gemmatimonadaceae bacterium]